MQYILDQQCFPIQLLRDWLIQPLHLLWFNKYLIMYEIGLYKSSPPSLSISLLAILDSRQTMRTDDQSIH